jgi:hypothetical protein
MTDKIQARAHSGAWMTHIELGFFSGNAFAEPLTFKVRDEGAFIQPALRIGRDEVFVSALSSSLTAFLRDNPERLAAWRETWEMGI